MPQAGWYDDPEDATRLRYWDGSAWTDERRPREVPPPPPGPSTPPPPGAAYGSSAVGGPGYGVGGASGSGGGEVLTSWPAPPRSFPEAIEVCLRKYVDFKGRASRSEYWYFALFTAIVGAVAGAFSDALVDALNLLFLLPTLSAGARRLHDIGRSGWNQLWFLLPIIGWIIIIVRLVRVGDPGPNAYG